MVLLLDRKNKTKTRFYMKKILLSTFILFLAISWLGIETTSAQTEGIKFFHGTYSQAVAKAKKENKLVFLDAYATWCGPCKWMARNTFTKQSVGDYFNDKFVSIKIDMEKGEGKQLARKFGLRVYPTLFFIDGDGKVIKKTEGAYPPAPLINLAKQVIGSTK